MCGQCTLDSLHARFSRRNAGLVAEAIRRTLEAGPLRLQDMLPRFLFGQIRITPFNGRDDPAALLVGIALPVRQPKRGAAQKGE